MVGPTTARAPLPEDTKYLYLDLSRRFDVQVDELKYSRQKLPSNLRVLVVHALRDLGFSITDIGRMLCRDHSTIITLLRREIESGNELYSQIKELCEKVYYNRRMIGSSVKRTGVPKEGESK
jgi:hypothetical protein